MGDLVYSFDGRLLGVIASGTVDRELTPLDLAATDSQNFIPVFNENLIRLASNFADGLEPRAALLGQLWYDRGAGYLKLKTTEGWSSAATALTGERNVEVTGRVRGTISVKADGVTGDLWLDECVTPGIFTKAQVGGDGLVTSGSHLDGRDIINALGYEPATEERTTLAKGSIIWWPDYAPIPEGYVRRLDHPLPKDETLIPISPI